MYFVGGTMSNQNKPVLSLAKLESKTLDNPLQVFYNGIKSVETKTAYTKTFREFLNSIEDFNGTFEEKTIQFIDFARKEPEKLKQLLKNYTIHLKERSKNQLVVLNI